MTRNHRRRQRRRDSESYTDMATVHESKADDSLHCAAEMQAEMQAEESQLPSKPTIVIMGMTGTGKSTFISHLTDDEVAVGHGLQSCTTEINRYWIVRSTNGQRICLIDTPGFDDTNKTDEAVLFKIIAVLCSIYADPGLNICGIVYVHRITDTRMSGSSIKSVRTFEKLCGRDSFRHVTLATSMWDHLDDSNQMIASEREHSLQSNPEFFGNLMREGAEMMRFYGNKKSAEEVIERVLGRTQKMVMKIQKELADDKLCLNETEVGEFLLGENKADISKLNRDLQDLQQQLVEAEEEGEGDLMTTIMEQEKDVTELIRESEIQKLGYGLNLE
ncbi:P-loop containing nucleoside triphosphate hydrolase protein [Corynespora cassiicola Philippines]|uniref:P-loop containing nucleoside triphosphate hydrolase protein n=1 Tax=Corynespora cassiicola Philippines TaxID=1448308 RepID=A0A2T2NFC2_CORCC|nr:P-loop containing nucleoside triphosphate hydrolase protein [Corynespora cassiicola Philippines]